MVDWGTVGSFFFGLYIVLVTVAVVVAVALGLVWLVARFIL